MQTGKGHELQWPWERDRHRLASGQEHTGSSMSMPMSMFTVWPRMPWASGAVALVTLRLSCRLRWPRTRLPMLSVCASVGLMPTCSRSVSMAMKVPRAYARRVIGQPSLYLDHYCLIRAGGAEGGLRLGSFQS